jgi:hypothetical protein
MDRGGHLEAQGTIGRIGAAGAAKLLLGLRNGTAVRGVAGAATAASPHGLADGGAGERSGPGGGPGRLSGDSSQRIPLRPSENLVHQYYVIKLDVGLTTCPPSEADVGVLDRKAR